MSGLLSASVIDKAKSDIFATVSKYVELEKSGKEYRGLCPFHSERTPSFSVMPEKGAYYCFGCGAGGDPIDFVSNFENIGFRDAVQRIVGNLPAGELGVTPRAAKKEEKPEWVPVVPVPETSLRPRDIFNRPKGEGFDKLTVSRRWEYRDANGGLIGLICRFDLPGGGKDVIPQSFCVNTKTGETSWRWLSFDKPRPIYGLDLLAANPDASVILVEGEKACDAARALLLALGVPPSKLVAVSWPGGGKAVGFVDWSPLAGRAVALWPDADLKPYKEGHPKAGVLMPFLEQPGTECMLAIGERLEGVAKSIKFVVPPEGVEDGWDLADQAPEGFSLLGHLRNSSLLIPEVLERFKVPEEVPAEDDAPVMDGAPWEGEPSFPPAAGGTMAPDDDEALDELVENVYFTILGYDQGTYFLFSHEKRQVLSITKGDLSDVGLIELAPANWWEEHFPGSNGIDRKAAANWLFRIANSRGIYDPRRIRGRGAWRDAGRHVFHHGDYLTVDGVETRIEDIRSKFVYPLSRSMPEPAAKLSDEEGRHLLKVATMVRWTKAASAPLMAGWVMLASICGSLRWRPHIWLTGAAGSGKSTIQSDYLAALLGELCLYAQGNSTEAGIRQELSSDALPVLVDELESNTEAERRKVESILAMIRQASTETPAKTLKGTLSGSAQNFHIRSMFCLASVNTAIEKKADIDRLTKLVIRPPASAVEAEADWEKLRDELHKIKTDTSLPSRLLARALSMLPVIHANIEVFTAVAAKFFGTQRDGDQFGTLLAGCWCLVHSHVASPDEAEKMMAFYDWKEHTEDHDQDDAQRALAAVLGAKLRVGNIGELTVYELIRETSPMHREGTCANDVAEATLKRHGIRVDYQTNTLLFGTGVDNLKALVGKMDFVTDLRGQLLRVAGATRVDRTVRFMGSASKCIGVPLGPILGEEKPQKEEEPF